MIGIYHYSINKEFIQRINCIDHIIWYAKYTHLMIFDTNNLK